MGNCTVFDMFSTAVVVINHRPEIIWPHLIEQTSWMKAEFKSIATVGGQPRKEGEIKKVTPLNPKYHPFFFKTLVLEPLRRFVYKAYTENRAGDYGFTGLEMLSLRDLGESTAVVFEAYLEFQSSTMTPEQLADYVRAAEKGSRAAWERNLARLSASVGTA